MDDAAVAEVTALAAAAAAFRVAAHAAAVAASERITSGVDDLSLEGEHSAPHACRLIRDLPLKSASSFWCTTIGTREVLLEHFANAKGIHLTWATCHLNVTALRRLNLGVVMIRASDVVL